ncbi:MAG: hypothetical protein ACREVN_05360 [Gammaproteobacteria bacterium]
MATKDDEPGAMAPEAGRIELLIDRDGFDAARVWVERTLDIYRGAVANPRSHAASGDYRPRFEASIRAFEAWLRVCGAGKS